MLRECWTSSLFETFETYKTRHIISDGAVRRFIHERNHRLQKYFDCNKYMKL